MRFLPAPLSETRQPSWIWAAVALVALLTALCFLNAVNNGFTNWDDPQYVTDNPLVRDFSLATLPAIFSSYVVGNYHPLTVLSLALDYAIYGLEPSGFHLTSIIIHVCNVVLVFLFIRLLVRNSVVALITALLFGINPMRVESVAWIAERKDVLYVFFYLASLCVYLCWIDSNTRGKRLYGASFGLFMCALLSKGQAVTLPLALLLIDYVRVRPFTIRLIAEKVPFFICSLIFGIVAIAAQKETGAIPDMPTFTLPERALFAFNNIYLYVAKLLVPTKLSAFYPYPIGADWTPYLVSIPSAVCVVVIVLLNLLGMGLWASPPLREVQSGGETRLIERLQSRSILSIFVADRVVVFGCSFFILNLALVLQVLPVGASTISERYSYASSIGLSLLIAYGYALVWGSAREDSKKWRIVAALLLVSYSSWLGYATIQRNRVWRNSESLWSDVLRQFPRVPLAYLNRGSYYQTTGHPERALNDFNAGLALNPDHYDILANRCDVFRMLGQYDQSLADCTRLIESSQNMTAALTNRGITYSMMGRLDEAFSDFEKAIARNPRDPKLYSNRGNLYDMSGRYDEAIESYSQAISLDPGYLTAYLNRGKTKMRKGDFQAAIPDFEVSARSSEFAADSYFYRSQCYRLTGDLQRAREDADRAQQRGRVIDQRYLEALAP